MYLAQLSAPELTGLMTVVAGMLVGFYTIVQAFIKAQERHAKADREDRKADRLERQEMTKAFNRVANATEQSARESNDRNGHLAELIIESKKATMEGLEHIRSQSVTEQTVQHQTVESKEA